MALQSVPHPSPTVAQTVSGARLLLKTALPLRTTTTTAPAPTGTGLAVLMATGASAVPTTTGVIQLTPTVPWLKRQKCLIRRWSVIVLKMGFFARMGFITPAVKVAPSVAPLVLFVLLPQRIALKYLNHVPRMGFIAQMGFREPAAKVARSVALPAYLVLLPRRIVLKHLIRRNWSVSVLRRDTFAQMGFTAPAVRVAPSVAPPV